MNLDKPFDIKKRTFQFAVANIKSGMAVQKEHY